MTIEYNISEEDFLNYHLFIASQSERVKKKRLRNKIIVPIIYIVFSLFFLYDNNIVLAIGFSILGILWFFLYPKWERWYYIKHYRKFIAEHLGTRIDKSVSLELNSDYFFMKDSGSKGKVSTSEIKVVNELKDIILVQLKSGHSIILPKNKIISTDQVKSFLHELTQRLGVKYNKYLNWQFK